MLAWRWHLALYMRDGASFFDFACIVSRILEIIQKEMFYPVFMWEEPFVFGFFCSTGV
jgi:hypothetical protein